MAAGAVPGSIMAGVKILEQGGNAIDAGMAIAAADGVLNYYTGLGGDCVLIIYKADQDIVTTIQGLGWAPKKATIDFYVDKLGGLTKEGPLASTIPGGFAGWIMAMDRYGTMSLAEVFQPAIELAEKGINVDKYIAKALQDQKSVQSKYPSTTAVYWKDGKPLELGDVLIQKDHANTFRKLADAYQANIASGRSAALRAAHDLFYKGEIAEAIVKLEQEFGGIIEYEDLATFEATEKPPIKINYRGIYDVYENPPTSQGHVVLQVLNILEGYDLKAMGRGAEYYHLLTEALKLSLRDRAAFLGDPNFVDVPIEGMLSKEYAAEQRLRIDPNKAMQWPIEPGNPWKYQPGYKGSELPIIQKTADVEKAYAVLAANGVGAGIVYDPGNTQTWQVVDKDRNVCAHTGSTNGTYGNGMVVPGYGFVLNNRLCTFQLDPESPNALEPRKVVFHTINNIFVMKNGRPFLTVGTPGGDRQTEGTLQVLLNVVEFGMDDIQMAIENARGINTLMHFYREFPYTVSNVLEMEITVGEEIIEAMRAKGHEVQVQQPLSISGNLSAVLIDYPGDGALYGGSDPRRQGYAIGW
jgi:gamma-glutamyltranspeptidase/glutathione hydrolase